MGSFVIHLNSPAAETTPLIAGGKGSNLAAMLRAGFPVPPGFIISTDAFRAFVEENGLSAALHEWSRPGTAEAPASPGTNGEAVRQLILRGSIPKEIERDILNGYRRLFEQTVTSHALHSHPEAGRSDLSPLPVAVRSSATTEDLPHISFAGGQETLLNVRGEGALLEAVARCWSSLCSERAADYLARRGISPARVGLAVVVQPMVPADCSGILFTVNPLTGDRDEAVINAAWGVGEAVVGARVTPDTVVVEKATRRVKHVEVGHKELMTVLTAAGTREVAVESRLRGLPVLSPEQVEALVETGVVIESYFGHPQDIEWAFAGGRLHILQARAVTTRPAAERERAALDREVPGDDDWPAVDELPPQDFDLWTHVNVGEIWPDPVSPLVWSGVPFIVGTTTRYALRGLNSPHLETIQWAKRLYGRVYYNEGAVTHLFSRELGLPASFVDRALGSRRSAAHRRDERFRPLRLLRRLPFLLRFTFGQLRAGRRLEALIPQADAWVADFMRRSLDVLDDRDLWGELQVWVDRFIHVMKVNTEVSISSISAFGLLERLTTSWCGRKDLAHDLVTGMPDGQAAEMGVSLWRIARSLSDEGLAHVVLDNDPETALGKLREMPEARAATDLLDSFLRRHGHHCPNEGEWLHPRWADAPELVIEMVAGYLRAGDEINPLQVEEAQSRRQREAVAYVRGHLGPARWRVFRRILAKAQTLVRLRNAGKDCYMKLLYPVRRSYASFGARWTRRGWLAHPDEIFFLSIPEVERIVEAGCPDTAGLEVARVVDERRRAFEYWATVESPECVGADRQPFTDPQVAEPSGPFIRGIPVSSGRARGTVRVIHSPREAGQLRQGDILVTRATDPGWTILFPLVSGLVVEIGGQLSHAAIVAREYGLPVVANVRHATRRLRSGQTVTVDGTTGRIYLDGGVPAPED